MNNKDAQDMVTRGMQNSRAPVRVGLVLNDELAPRWIHNTIEQLLSAEPLKLAAIVFDKRVRARAHRLVPRSMLFVSWSKFDKWMFSKTDDPLAPERRTYAVPTITLAPIDGNAKRTLSRAEVARLRECNLDVLVQLGSGDLPNELLSCAKYGVWTFHYSGRAEAEDEVALFRTLNAGTFTYEIALRAATGDPHCAWVLCRHVFAIHLFSLHYNLALDYRRRAQILLRRLSDLHREGWAGIAVKETDGNAAGGRIDCASLNRVTLSWLIRSMRRLFARICFREQWVLAYCKTDSRTDTEHVMSDSLAVVVPPRGQNYADPFPFEYKGKTYIFFEKFADEGPGTICCAELYGDGTLGETHQVLTRSYHLSYPFVFEWHGDIYLLPETSNNSTVEVYGAIDFPNRWELAAVLLRNVLAVDATILEYQGRLWLFAAGLGGLGTEWSELSLFSTDSLFGNWHPHPKNPIVRDLRRARPGGRFFSHQGFLIRPGQDCSERYGYAISLNRVDVLSETDYKETRLTTILPTWMPRGLATHTFNQQVGVTILDGEMLVPRWIPREWKLRAFLDGSRLRMRPGSPPSRVMRRCTLPLPELLSIHSISGCLHEVDQARKSPSTAKTQNLAARLLFPQSHDSSSG